jgi:hypothetical protein
MQEQAMPGPACHATHHTIFPLLSACSSKKSYAPACGEGAVEITPNLISLSSHDTTAKMEGRRNASLNRYEYYD